MSFESTQNKLQASPYGSPLFLNAPLFTNLWMHLNNINKIIFSAFLATSLAPFKFCLFTSLPTSMNMAITFAPFWPYIISLQNPFMPSLIFTCPPFAPPPITHSIHCIFAPIFRLANINTPFPPPIIFIQLFSAIPAYILQANKRPPLPNTNSPFKKTKSSPLMNLVLDAFERVLYPTGAAAERRRRASTGLLGGGTGTGTPSRGAGAVRPIAGPHSPKQQKSSTASSSTGGILAGHHHHFRHPHSSSSSTAFFSSSPSAPGSPFSPSFSASRREKAAAAANRRRRSVTPNGGGNSNSTRPIGNNKAKTEEEEEAIEGRNGENDGGKFVPICHSNSLTGISAGHQFQFDQNNEQPISPAIPATMAMASSQHGGGGGSSGGISGVARSRTSANAGGIGRRKKSVMHVGRKQSVASLLFTALSSPTIDPNRLKRRQSRAAAFASANRRHSPPPRQWSVPEKNHSNSGGEEGDEEEGERGEEEEEEEEEQFRFIQKTRSISMSTPGGGRSPIRQLSGEDPSPGPAPPFSPQHCCASSFSTMGSPILPSSPFTNCCPSCASSSSSSVLLGFFPPPPPLPPGSFRPLNGRRGSETACLTDWIRLRAEAANTLSQALLLRCVDPEPAFPFLQLANLADHEQTIRMAEELAQNGHAQFGCFEELFALERAKSSSTVRSGFHGSQGTILSGNQQQDEDGPHYMAQHHGSSGCMSPAAEGQSFGTKNSLGHRQQQHRGFILVCFRLLDEENEGSPPGSGNCGSTLAKSAELESSWLSWTGAAQIYKYSPRAWCLRRLSLLRRVHPGFPTLAPFAYVLLCEFDAILHPTNALAALDMCERLRARNCGLVALYQVRQCFASSSSSCSSMAANSSSNAPQHHSSAQSLASNSLSPHWSPHQLRRQQLARMGRSQDERGRQGSGALLRMIHARDGSLGWDQPAVQQPTHQSPIIQTQPTTVQPQQIGAHHWMGEPGIGTSL